MFLTKEKNDILANMHHNSCTDHSTEVLEKHTKYFSWTVSSLKYLDIRFLLSVIC